MEHSGNESYYRNRQGPFHEIWNNATLLSI